MKPTLRLDRESDRVRRHTRESAAEAIDHQTQQNVREYGQRSSSGISCRLRELEREWDVERTLEANAATLALTGAVLGTTVNRKWFWLTGGVLAFLTQHALSGWCPPLPVLRKLGVRTRNEIDQEKYALKALRGDLRGAEKNPEEALGAVSDFERSKDNGTERDPDPVRRYTTESRLRQLDAAMRQRVRLYSTQPPEIITARIEELRREWSIERYLQINVAAVGITTAVLAGTRNRKWGYATCAGLSLFLIHAVEGFDPPLFALRKAGVRTRAEINREIHALKVLRGDFDDTTASVDRTERALEAAAK